MQYHKALKEIVKATSKLTFETIYGMTKSFEDSPFAVDVKVYKYCNKMGLEKFEFTFQKALNDTYNILSKESNVEEKLAVIISLSTLKGSLFNGKKYTGTEVEEPIKSLQDQEAYKNGAMDYNSVTDMKESKEDFYNIIFKGIEELLSKLSLTILPQKKDVSQKMEWNAKPAQLAFLLNELFAKGWINMPVTDGDPSYRKMAGLCDKLFSFLTCIVFKLIKYTKYCVVV
jgi:hypothetical protein